jgi:hypothetical protein
MGKKTFMSPKIPKIPKRNSKNYSKIPAVISQMTNCKTCLGIFFKFSKNLTNPEKNLKIYGISTSLLVS